MLSLVSYVLNGFSRRAREGEQRLIDAIERISEGFVEGGGRCEEREHAQEEADVTDPVYDERLFSGVGVAPVLVPEADQEVGTEAYPLPADEHEHEVIRHHQDKHREREEIEIGEVTGVTLVPVHVADGVEVDEGAHP